MPPAVEVYNRTVRCHQEPRRAVRSGTKKNVVDDEMSTVAVGAVLTFEYSDVTIFSTR
jgi:hypothetical protein